jgi:hypothetical protein
VKKIKVVGEGELQEIQSDLHLKSQRLIDTTINDMAKQEALAARALSPISMKPYFCFS